jgi:hypothetical protein
MRHARSPFKIAAPWSPCLSFYLDIASGGDVGGQLLARKSRLREIYVVFTGIQFAHASFASAANKRTVRRFRTATAFICDGTARPIRFQFQSVQCLARTPFMLTSVNAART